MGKIYSRYLLVVFIITIWNNVNLSAQTPQYYKGLGTSTNTIPMNNTGSHCQQLYEPGDFNVPPISGLITKIYFRNSSAGASGTYNNFSVAFIQNNLTQFPDNTFLTGLTPALTASSITINGNATAGGWYEIVLATPFMYDHTKTLIVEIKYDSKTGGMTGYTTSAGSGINKRLSIVTAPGAATGLLSTAFGDWGMDIIPATPCIDPPDAGSATVSANMVCPSTSVILNLTGHTQGTGQTYSWESGPSSAGPWMSISGSSSLSSLSVNPTTTTWYRAQVTCGASTVPSNPVELQVTPALPGATYTVNPLLPPGSGNYVTLQAAIDAMNCGIAGPVVFNVSNTIFNEQLTIPAVAGASSVNTITFNGNGATIQATPVSATRQLIRLDGADWVRINNFNLVAQAGSTFGWGIHLTNGSDNNIINGNTIDISAVTSTTQSNSAGIVASGSNTSVITDGEASFNTISNNTIIGAYQGIIMNANNNSLFGVGNVISNNEVKNWLITGIELTEQDGAMVIGNNIHRTDRTDVGTTISQGIELGDGTINTIVNGNRIHDSHTAASTHSGTFYGIIVTGTDALPGSENRIINNLVYRINSLTGTQYGMYNSGSNGVFYYHNTIILDHAASTSGITRGFYQLTLADNIQFRNNLVYIARGGTGVKYAVYFGTSTSTITSNQNVLYNISTSGTNGIGFYDGTGYTTLVDWQGANAGAWDQQSVSVDPLFLNAPGGDYTPMSLQVNDLGLPVGVLSDINGNPRSATNPDPGAFEFNIAAGINMGAEALVTPAVAANGCYTGAETVTIRIRNSSSSTINFATNPVTVTTNVTGATTQMLTAVVNTGMLPSDGTLDVPMTGTLDMSAAGIYTFNAFTTVVGDVMPANDAMPPDTRNKNVLIVGTASSNPQSYCITPNTPTLSVNGANGYGSVQWQQSTTPGSGFANIPGGNTIPYTVASAITQTMYYRAILSCDANMQTSNEVTVELFNPSVTGTTPDAICGTGTATLAATGTGNAGFNWYAAPTGGTPVGSGSSFTTPVISSTTTYYVTATTGGISSNIGLPMELASTPGFGTTNFGLVFDVFAQFTLNSVTVYPGAAAPNTPGTVTIDVINGSGTIVHTATVNVIGNPTATAYVVPLGFVIAPGTNYKIRPGSRSASITHLRFEPSATAPPGGNYGYPFQAPGIVSITHSTLSAAPGNNPRLDLYYYFYDWSISTGCETPRVPVVATVQPEPAATMSYAGSPYCGNAGTANITFSGTTGGTFSSTSGLSINSGTGSVNLAASTPGSYTVTYTVAASGVCPQFTFTTPITITAVPSATISYPGSPYCGSGGTASVVRTGTPGGTYSSTTGLSLNNSTGAVNLATSVPGVYTVTYTISAGGGCSSFSTTTQIIVAASNSWTGIVSSDWNTAGNWCGGIPGPGSDVIIPAFASNMPLLTGGSGNARHITVLAGASLTVGAGGILNIYGDLYNNGTFNAAAGNLAFRGTSIQKIPSFTAINVTQDGPGGVLMMGDFNITGTLAMTAGHFYTNGNDVNLSGNASGSLASHIVAGPGSMVHVLNLGSGNTRTIPVGHSPATYNPVGITANAGHVTDILSVRVDPDVYVTGVSGDVFQRDHVDRTWTISEAVTGGSNLNLTFGWSSADELPGFDRVRSQVVRLSGNSWIAAPVSNSGGSNPYTQTMANVSSLSRFAVRSESLPFTRSGALYPNPARNELNVVVNLASETLVTISVFDARGSLVMRQQSNVNANLSRTMLDISRLIPGTYLVRVATPSNEEVFAERFIKLP